ncbi:MAG: hypothetical protein ABIS38_05840 [Sphingomicrobium sp.]
MKRALLLAAPLALAACASYLPGSGYPPPPPPPVVWGNATATIGFGGQAVLNGLRVRALTVIEDSRCPINARCVWAGRLILTVEIDQPGAGPARINLTLGQPQPVAGGTLTLVAAEPGKLAGAEGNPPASRFTFELTP